MSAIFSLRTAMARDFMPAPSKIQAGASLADPDMARSGDARPGVSGVLLKGSMRGAATLQFDDPMSLTLPGASASGLFMAAS